jgi:hypothetical protein
MREIRTSGSTRGQQAAFGHLLSYSTGELVRSLPYATIPCGSMTNFLAAPLSKSL